VGQFRVAHPLFRGVVVITGSSAVYVLHLILNSLCGMFALTLCLGSAYFQLSHLCPYKHVYGRFCQFF
jgi:hypothetical protein